MFLRYAVGSTVHAIAFTPSAFGGAARKTIAAENNQWTPRGTHYIHTYPCTVNSANTVYKNVWHLIGAGPQSSKAQI